MNGHDEELTAGQASRLAVTALTADLEYWARTVAVAGVVGVDELTSALDILRESSVPAA